MRTMAEMAFGREASTWLLTRRQKMQSEAKSRKSTFFLPFFFLPFFFFFHLILLPLLPYSKGKSGAPSRSFPFCSSSPICSQRLPTGAHPTKTSGLFAQPPTPRRNSQQSRLLNRIDKRTTLPVVATSPNHPLPHRHHVHRLYMTTAPNCALNNSAPINIPTPPLPAHPLGKLTAVEQDE